MMTDSNTTLPKISLERFASTARADYRFSPFNVLLLVALMLAGLVIHVVWDEFRVEAVIYVIAAALVLAGVFRVAQVWEAVVVTGAIVTLAGYLVFRKHSAVSNQRSAERRAPATKFRT